jgi:uncharacterized protein (UPF0335 family)
MSRFNQILTDAADLVERKNHDYQGSYKTIRDKYGPVGFHVRIADKLARIEQLNKAEAKVDESILDTLRDIIGYCTVEINYVTGKPFKCITEIDVTPHAWELYKVDRSYGTQAFKRWIDASWEMYEKYGNPEYLYTMIKDTAFEIMYREEAE